MSILGWILFGLLVGIVLSADLATRLTAIYTVSPTL
jgi:hypothetical protein